ncbi:MAG TPA: hypothetical protein VFK44_06905 [Bacillales bacterium]|nr:hypothetical protein [Bacillales bacterium]
MEQRGVIHYALESVRVAQHEVIQAQANGDPQNVQRAAQHMKIARDRLDEVRGKAETDEEKREIARAEELLRHLEEARNGMA